MRLRIKSYFKPGQEQLCPFCAQVTAKLVDGHLKALGNKTHVEVPSVNGKKFIFNCCKDCATKEFSQRELDELFVATLKYFGADRNSPMRSYRPLAGKQKEIKMNLKAPTKGNRASARR